MDAFIARINRFDPHRIALAPLLGLLAGFLVNRAHGGAAGWALLGEMLLGALFTTFAASVLANVSQLMRERDQQALVSAEARALQALARRRALIDAESERYRIERFFREQILTAAVRTEKLELALLEQRAEANALRGALARLEVARPQTEFGALAERLARLENANRIAEEARNKIDALEQAQEQMRAQQVALDRRATQEAEELKASLLQLAISESQRMRNMSAPENDQSGRIIELESRIHRLAREIAALSSRREVVAGTPTAPQSAAPEKARIGFLQAMLDANKTLRKQIKEAA
ncbi:MAG: hypothetical protein H6841_08470 [Planctomycetes bacterium]|nr:hypothetical protein [Planctomycetota bacterium]MCB9934793.1 hypothetical protein [Planctomycetota bacterium]